jgi:uncharacterized membrane protein YgaE (UPF0421/DUF939 family)
MVGNGHEESMSRPVSPISWDQAAERSKSALRRRRESLVAAARPIVHTAVAASGAWLVAREVLGHPRPFFAPVAAVITLGLAVGRRRRRAIEMAIGVAVGIGVADALVMAIGTGTLQIAIVVAIAMTAALLVGGGPLIASQAATSAVLVATLQAPGSGFSFERSLDALTGATVALLVATVILPVDPVDVVRRAIGPVLDRLAGALDSVGAGLEARHLDTAEEALLLARAIEPDLVNLREALVAARESVRLSLRPRRTRVRLERYATLAAQVELAVYNVRVLARGAARAISLGDATPPALPQAVHSLAYSVRALDHAFEDGDAFDRGSKAALEAAGLANHVLQETGNMSALHLVGQVRSTAVDLLRGLGVDYGDARDAVRTGGAAPVGVRNVS